MKVDLHTHTCYSYDNFTPMDKTIAAIKRSGIDCVAVTDHNQIAGALKMQKIAPFKVIVGEEIFSAEGEIIGLFLKERIPRGLSARETIRRIREQGGLTYLPHPFTWFVRRLKNRLVRPFVQEGLIDIVEVYNASAIVLTAFKKVHELVTACPGMAMAASTDAHIPGEFVGACTEMEGFHSPQEFLANLKKGHLQMKPGFLFSSFQLIYNYYVRTKLFKAPHGEELEAKWQRELAG